MQIGPPESPHAKEKQLFTVIIPALDSIHISIRTLSLNSSYAGIYNHIYVCIL